MSISNDAGKMKRRGPSHGRRGDDHDRPARAIDGYLDAAASNDNPPPGDRPMSGRRLATDVAWNLFGLVAPAIAAAVAIPFLLRGFGTDRLGVLTLAWVAIGAFTLLDFGLGRSLTRDVARRRANGEAAEIRPLVTAALGLLLLLGTVAAAALVLGRGWISAGLSMPEALDGEVQLAIVWVGLALPFLTVSSGARGVLEAYGRFDLANWVRIPLGVLTYVGPALMLPVSTSIADAVAVLAVSRAAAAIAWVAMAFALIGPARSAGRAQARHVREVASTGLWMTLANVAGAVLAYVDRVVLGLTVSVGALAFYSTPQELIGKLTVVPVALNSVLYPAISARSQAAGQDTGSRLYAQGLAYTFVLLLPIALVSAALAPEWLRMWLGASFAASSHGVVTWLSLSVLLQSLAVTPLTVLQAAGRASLTAWLQLAQVPVFTAAVWFASRQAGIEGAAFVWAARMLLDLTLLLWSSRQAIPGAAAVVRQWWLPLALTVPVFAALRFLEAWPGRVALLVTALVLFALAVPRLLGPNDVVAWRRLLAERLRPAADPS